MSHPLVSSRSRRIAFALVLSALTAGAAGAEPQHRLAAPEPTALESLGDFFHWLAAEFLGGDADDLDHADEKSELDSEIEVDPPNPRTATTAPGFGNHGDSHH